MIIKEAIMDPAHSWPENDLDRNVEGQHVANIYVFVTCIRHPFVS